MQWGANVRWKAEMMDDAWGISAGRSIGAAHCWRAGLPLIIQLGPISRGPASRSRTLLEAKALCGDLSRLARALEKA